MKGFGGAFRLCGTKKTGDYFGVPFRRIHCWDVHCLQRQPAYKSRKYCLLSRYLAVQSLKTLDVPSRLIYTRLCLVSTPVSLLIIHGFRY